MATQTEQTPPRTGGWLPSLGIEQTAFVLFAALGVFVFLLFTVLGHPAAPSADDARDPVLGPGPQGVSIFAESDQVPPEPENSDAALDRP